MRIASIKCHDKECVGIVLDDHVAILPERFGDMVNLISAGKGRLEEARIAANDCLERYTLEEVLLCAPIRRFRRDVLCTGWNYWDHFEESEGKREGQDVPRPKAPTFFTKSPFAVIGPHDPIAYDSRISGKWDYEAEVAVIIGRKCRSVSVNRAHEVIWGYCLANDISQRDLQRRHGGQWFKGKSIDYTMPFGPWIVTADAIDPLDIRLTCHINGAKMQDSTLRQMAFNIPELIAELSFGMTLLPGDVLLTGTPSGIGNAREPQLFLRPGDEVLTAGSGLGELRNVVACRDLAGDTSVDICSMAAPHVSGEWQGSRRGEIGVNECLDRE